MRARHLCTQQAYNVQSRAKISRERVFLVFDGFQGLPRRFYTDRSMHYEEQAPAAADEPAKRGV